MLDINFIRKNAEAVRNDLRKREQPDKITMLDQVISLDEKWRKIKADLDELRSRRNRASQEINKAKKQGNDASELIAEVQELPDKIKDAEKAEVGLKQEIKDILMRIPNILHESVPVGKDDTENEVIREWGDKPNPDFELKNHGALLQSKGLADFDKAAEVSGNGFNYLFGDFVLLELALQRFAIEKLIAKGYKPVFPPYMIRRKPYEGVTDLEDFETMMYKIDGEDLYLIATSEHAIGALHMNDVFDEKSLPIKYVGISACFRKEIGSHGVDEKGLFRVHQFNKIEQFIYCRPEDSWKFHEELIQNAEEIFQELKLPYRVVNICTGDIGIVAAKKYDIEVWMPREKAYKEVVSCSNCTAYQAVRLGIKFNNKGNREYIHTLNSTAVATGRALRAIVENYQNADGTISVPEALMPFMNGKKILGD